MIDLKKVSAILIAVALLTVLIPAAGLNVFADAEPTAIVSGPSNYTVPEGGSVTLETVAKGTGLSFEWFIRFKGTDYPLMTTPETAGAPFSQFIDSAGVSSDAASGTLTLDNVRKGLDGSEIYCIVRGADGVAVTSRAILTVSGDPDCLSATPMSLKNLTVTQYKLVKYALNYVPANDGSEFEFTWYVTSVDDITTIKASPDSDDSSVLVVDTAIPGVYFYTCKVTKTNSLYPGKSNVSYSNLAKFIITEENTDPDYTMGIQITKEPAKKNYTVGDKPDTDGIGIRAFTGQGFFDVKPDSAENKTAVYPNNIYSTEQKDIVVVYDGCAASVPVSVSPKAGGVFSIYAVSGTEYSTYIPGQAFSLKVAAKNANSDVTFSWYASDKDGFKGELVDEGSELPFPSGLPESLVNQTNYYLCVGNCDGAESSVLFSVILMAPDSSETAAPATAAPATGDPGTAAPATDATATAAEAKTDAPSAGGGGLSKGAIIGIICVSAGLFAVILIVVILSVVASKKKG